MASLTMSMTRATPLVKAPNAAVRNMRAAPMRARPARAGVAVRATAEESSAKSRRAFLAQTAAGVALVSFSADAPAALAESPLCDAGCMAGLDKLTTVTTASGLKYTDIVVGTGPKPFPGVQLVADFVAMVENPKDKSLFTFESTIDKKKPADIRVTGDPETCNVIAGLDEGLMTMQVGGVRRLYIPGALAFPKGLASAPGRPRVAPFSDVIFDVKLLYIPGLEEEEDGDYVLDIDSIE